ncbi:hypothetical protein TGCAST_256220A, partial [Toxoplasma gondii CAST]
MWSAAEPDVVSHGYLRRGVLSPTLCPGPGIRPRYIATVVVAVDVFPCFSPLDEIWEFRSSPCDGTLEPADPMDSPGTWLVDDFDVDFLRARFPLEEMSAERQSSSCDCVLEATDCASGTGNEGVAFAVDSFRGFLPLEVVCDCRPSPCDG